ncbi:MAG: hypothetical protein RMK60_11710 [Burkholderiales bacterium]|nr:hypothetical protein [Burkholderiales bacterium]
MIPPELRRPAALAALGVFTALLSVSLALHERQQAARAYRAAAQTQAQAQAELARLPQRVADLRAAGHWQQDPAARAFLSGGDRLAWLTALAQTQAQLRLERFGWRLQAPQAGPLPGLSATAMQVDLLPLDAEGLHTWLARLERAGAGPFTVQSCDWSAGERPQRMHCRLLWWGWQGPGAS